MTAPDSRLRIRLLAALTTVAGFAACAPPPPSTQEDPVARGRYLVGIGGCGDCHTPKKMTAQGPAPDDTMALAGHRSTDTLPPAPAPTGGWMVAANIDATAWAGPWGVSYSANLTPDPKTGLGGWTEETFLAAMRTGKHLGAGRPILPPMPWQGIGAMREADLRAIFAYLKSIKPIENAVPEAILNGPPPTASRGEPRPPSS